MGAVTKKPTVPEVLPLVREYYLKHPVGGNLHIVIDDGNVDDKYVKFCLEQATSQNDSGGIAIACLLLMMSKTQRRKIYLSGKD